MTEIVITISPDDAATQLMSASDKERLRAEILEELGHFAAGTGLKPDVLTIAQENGKYVLRRKLSEGEEWNRMRLAKYFAMSCKAFLEYQYSEVGHDKFHASHENLMK
jgi:hypothetical protein